ncbi:MAG: biotin--[acetyl-CoA-carboxylase] ligase [bacterium]|nr:biotin--[acetyl-CoA-carboxylase] ligase [bacterium]MCY4271491.1 biotin--[acetyl-CoA-carboxylase] ligase [bacterium]
MSTVPEFAVSGFQVEWVAETGSTNADLLAAARRGAGANRVLVADFQRAGRGRRGRTWEAAPGSSLLFSVLIRPELPVEAAHLVTTALALSAAEACDSRAGVRPGLKWPNDLVVADRKLAGVLAESLVAGDGLEAVVAGMGLNVKAGAAPSVVSGSATAGSAVALEDVCGSVVDRRGLLEEILGRLAHWMGRIETADGQAALLAAARRESATLGRRVSVALSDGSVCEGLAQDLDERGALLLEGGIRVVVGDVVHLRDATREQD